MMEVESSPPHHQDEIFYDDKFAMKQSIYFHIYEYQQNTASKHPINFSSLLANVLTPAGGSLVR